MLLDVFISTELEGYMCSLFFLLCPYTSDKEVSHRLREEEEWWKLPYQPSIYLGCGSQDWHFTASVTSLFPNNPFLQLTEEQSCYLKFSVWAFQVAWPHSSCPSKQARNLVVSLPFLPHLSCVFSCFILLILFWASLIFHIHPFISTLQVQALAIPWLDLVTDLLSKACLYTFAPPFKSWQPHTPLSQKKKKKKSSSESTCFLGIMLQRSSLIHNYILHVALPEPHQTI